MISSKLIHFLDKKAILGQIISQYSGCYPTKDKKVIRKLDKIFIFEKIKKLSIALGQGYYVKPLKLGCSLYFEPFTSKHRVTYLVDFLSLFLCERSNTSMRSSPSPRPLLKRKLNRYLQEHHTTTSQIQIKKNLISSVNLMELFSTSLEQ